MGTEDVKNRVGLEYKSTKQQEEELDAKLARENDKSKVWFVEQIRHERTFKDSLRVGFKERDNHGLFWVMEPAVFKEVKRGQLIPDTFISEDPFDAGFIDEFLQAIMNMAWGKGLRPEKFKEDVKEILKL